MGHPLNGWNFVTAGTARDANSCEEIFIELNRVGFDGAVSIELEYAPRPDQIVEWVREAYTATDRLMRQAGLRG